MNNKNKIFSIGLDLGGTNLKCGVVSETGELIGFSTAPVESEKGKDHILNLLIQVINDGLSFAGKKQITVIAAGIGCPGSIDFERGISLGPTPHIPDWENVDIRGTVEIATGLPVYANNDAKLMTYGEYRTGAGRGYHTVAGLTIGTGIGGGIIINGEILSGCTFNAAEFGHMTVEHNGRPCSCGNRGCLEQYAGGKFLLKDFMDALRRGQASTVARDSGLTVKDIISVWKNGDVLAAQIIGNAVNYLGAGIANIVHIFNPDIITVGGGISEAGEPLIKAIFESAYSRVMKTARNRLLIVQSKNGNRAGTIGAGLWAIEKHKKQSLQ